MFDAKLKFDQNTESVDKRAHQRIYLLRRINSSGVSKPIMCTVYLSYFYFYILETESLSNLPVELNSLSGRKMSSKRPKVSLLYDHILGNELTLMPSGRSYVQTPSHLFLLLSRCWVQNQMNLKSCGYVGYYKGYVYNTPLDLYLLNVFMVYF